ncbi:hypothetical protein SAMN04488063_2829 [Halopelagius inordinatus]|uniref:Uncharacterized protein n=1 Tax=Halopelagius inordinatus TaxID=553467 RepID=A0A1I2U906_9EURY|nr:hypothetical protein [Halopelagius inordinatus]SFG73578.1 hypothetical protein SAMN04488063_2829 [Halopelagius inordinatus]
MTSSQSTRATHDDSERLFEPTITAILERSRVRGGVKGLAAGGVATVVMSCFRISVSKSPPPTSWFWAKYVSGGEPEDHVVPGAMLHLFYGIVSGGVFGALVSAPTDSSAETEKRTTALGLVYGVLLSVFGVVTLIRRVLRLDLDDDERFVFHLSHVVYGLVLGAWFGSER